VTWRDVWWNDGGRRRKFCGELMNDDGDDDRRHKT
jgi:hypothetical protein